jgi:predicted nucleic-acid-binding Zn-ribbon protein
MKTINRCSECGSDEIYAHAISASGGYGFDLLSKLGGHNPLFNGKKLEIYVCAQCGYMRFFIPEELVNEIPEKFQRV